MELNFEEALAKLEAIVETLESAELTLDAALETFEEGIQLSRLCTKKLEEAEIRVQKLLATEDGDFETEPFEVPSVDQG